MSHACCKLWSCDSLTSMLAHRERELAAVRVEAADVELIANELEIPKDKADRVLREHGGDVGRALQSLVLNA